MLNFSFCECSRPPFLLRFAGNQPPAGGLIRGLHFLELAFENPRHDYPKRIVYELSADGRLTAAIGYIKGGTPRQFEFTRESR